MAYTSIDDPEAFFRIKLYAGNGSSDRAIVFDTTDTTMQPNLVWIKNRTSSSTNHAWLSSSLNTGSPPFSISSGNSDANGYGNFEYSVPSGYLALCTKNLGSDGG